MLIYLLS